LRKGHNTCKATERTLYENEVLRGCDAIGDVIACGGIIRVCDQPLRYKVPVVRRCSGGLFGVQVMIPGAILAYALRCAVLHPPVQDVPSKVSTVAETVARHYDVPAALVLAVAKVESHFHRHAVSRSGASGIMQIMPGTAMALHVADVFSVRQSMSGAARYLRGLISRFGLPQAVYAYNTGHAGTPWQVAHSGYVHAVLHDYHKMRVDSWRG
jgi:hypothetical protein